MGKQDTRNRNLELCRLIATMAVFNGHFLGIGIATEKSLEILKFGRESWLGRSVLAFFMKEI